jgi:hypothetical protein
VNTEELKIIMDALVSLGEAGKSGFIWWLVMKYALHYAATFAFIVGAVVVIRMVVNKFATITHGNQLGMELCQLLKTKDYEYRGWDNEAYRATTKSEIINRVRELLAQSKQP